MSAGVDVVFGVRDGLVEVHSCPGVDAAVEGFGVECFVEVIECGGQADDLKRISGVGPKLEGVLHDNGVFHFDQIAAWNDAEIAYMDEQLSFKGRIARDNWIEQAAAFAAEQE